MFMLFIKVKIDTCILSLFSLLAGDLSKTVARLRNGLSNMGHMEPRLLYLMMKLIISSGIYAEIHQIMCRLDLLARVVLTHFWNHILKDLVFH